MKRELRYIRRALTDRHRTRVSRAQHRLVVAWTKADTAVATSTAAFAAAVAA